MKTFTIKGDEDNPKYTIISFEGTSDRSLTNFPDIISVFSPNEQANNILEYYTNQQPAETQFFTSLKPGRGYCIRSKRTFTIETDETTSPDIPNSVSLISTTNGPSWHILTFPFKSSVKISNYSFIKKVQRESVKTNSSTLEEYNADQPLNQQPFTTLDPGISYIIYVTSTGTIYNPDQPVEITNSFTVKDISKNRMLQITNTKPDRSWLSPKINIWINSNLYKTYSVFEKLFHKQDSNLLFNSLLPSYGNSFDVLNKKINIFATEDKRIFNQLSYDSDGRSKVINLVFYNEMESVYYFKETPEKPTFSFYEDICKAKSSDSKRIFGIGFNVADLNSILTAKFLSLAQHGSSSAFEQPNNLADTNFKFVSVESNFSLSGLTNLLLEALMKFDFIETIPTIKTLTKGNCFNKCFFNSTFFDPNEIITNTKIATKTILNSFDIDQIGFLKPFATTNKKADFIDVELFDGSSYSFAVTNGQNGSWLVRRNNSTSQWTLVGFFGATNNQIDPLGFDLSDKIFMRWGSSLKTACRWEYLLNQDYVSPIISFNA